MCAHLWERDKIYPRDLTTRTRAEISFSVICSVVHAICAVTIASISGLQDYIVDFWLQISHCWGFRLLHTWSCPIIFVLDGLAVQELGPRAGIRLFVTNVCEPCMQGWFVDPVVSDEIDSGSSNDVIRVT